MTWQQVIAESLSAMNVLLALLVAYYQLRQIKQCRQRSRRQPADAGTCWIRAAHIAISLYWAGLYVFILFSAPGSYDSVWFGQVFVRPAFTLTLALMAASAIARGKKP